MGKGCGWVYSSRGSRSGAGREEAVEEVEQRVGWCAGGGGVARAGIWDTGVFGYREEPGEGESSRLVVAQVQDENLPPNRSPTFQISTGHQPAQTNTTYTIHLGGQDSQAGTITE